MDESENFDLSSLTFEEFERFFFHRAIIDENEGKGFVETYCPGMFSFASSSPAKTVELLARLMSDFKKIGARYTLAQIDQGVWALFGPQIQIQDHLWIESVSLDLRQPCIRAMIVPYRDFVCGHPAQEMVNCFDMWWDMLAGAFWTDHGDCKINDDDKAVLNAMFEALCEILSLPDSRCEQYALHGLGHLRHPEVPKVVQSFIDVHRKELHPAALAWIERCRDGTVM